MYYVERFSNKYDKTKTRKMFSNREGRQRRITRYYMQMRFTI